MPEGQMPFFDPTMAEVMRRLMLDTEFGVLGLEEQARRLSSDFTLMMGDGESPGRVQRQFDEDSRSLASSISSRGFHGEESGPMRQGLGRLAQDQAEAMSMFEQQYTRSREDIARGIANLEARAGLEGGEAVAGGAREATQRSLQRLPF